MEKLRGEIVLETLLESDPPALQTGEMGIPPRVPVAIGSIGAGEGNGGEIPPAFLNASYDHTPDKNPLYPERLYSLGLQDEKLSQREFTRFVYI